ILTTAQYDLPPAENVVPLVFPFAKAKPVAVEELQGFTQLWAHLPRPWIVGVIGAGKFPIRFGPSELAGFASALNRMAQRCKGSIILMDSPRSPSGAIAAVAARMSGPHWMWTRGQGANPYQAALALGDHLAVTSDSVAMVGEMVRTGKPTHVYRLPVSALVPQWSAQAGVAAVMARRGVLSPPRHVAAFLSGLTDRGWIGDLEAGHPPATPYVATDEHDRAVTRIIALWHGHAMD
ncbi:MAG: hypothetical protein GYA66_15755, partial [Phyllobacteriaceae bacterium]|nr:hypothetical protein [Phyllobacteriaceae bacterium]